MTIALKAALDAGLTEADILAAAKELAVKKVVAKLRAAQRQDILALAKCSRARIVGLPPHEDDKLGQREITLTPEEAKAIAQRLATMRGYT